MRSLATIICALVTSAAVLGQFEATQTLPLGHSAGEREAIEFRTFTVGAAERPGGYGWVNVTVRNLDAEAHDVNTRILSAYVGMETYEAHRAMRLTGGEEASFTLPVVESDFGLQGFVDIDGSTQRLSLGGGARSATGGLRSVGFLTARRELAQAWDSARAADLVPIPGSGSTSSGVGFKAFTARQGPDRWTWLTGFDCLLIDPADSDLTPERQRLVVDYVTAGGNAIVLGRAAARALQGPLRELVSAAIDDAAKPTGAAGLGRWVLTEHDAPDSLSESAAQWVGLGPLSSPLPSRTTSGAPHDALCGHLAIPGLGEIPLRLFVGLIGVFVFVVLLLTRALLRRRAAARILVAIPAVGLLFAAAILGYGLVAEGLGTRGVRRSFTILDQRRHAAVTTGQRELYAAFAPPALRPRPTTWINSADVMFQSWRSDRAHRFVLDLGAGGALASNALPSRAPTHFATTSVDLARERLRFRRHGAEFSVIDDPGFRVARGAGNLVVCDFAGQTWIAKADGTLAVAGDRDAWDACLKLAERFAAVGWRKQEPFGWDTAPPVFVPSLGSPVPASADPDVVRKSLQTWITERLGRALTPGTYVALTDSAPDDDLGLDVKWEAEQHLVYGLLAAEDISE